MDWQSLTQYLFSFSIVVSAISWVAKKIGDHYLERRFAAYEKELELNAKKTQFDLDLYFFKNSKLHEKHLDIISTLYGYMVVMEREMSRLTALVKIINENPENENKERYMRASRTFNVFLEFYTENRIFFSKPICDSIDALLENLSDCFSEYNIYQYFKEEGELNLGVESAKKAHDIMRNKFPNIITQTEEEFRKMLLVH